MDSVISFDGKLIELIDEVWQKDKLPFEDIPVPQSELPDPEIEYNSGSAQLSIKEQDNKWTDLLLSTLSVKMEFPRIESGHCCNKECNLLDILPLTCDRCQQTFCHQHFNEHCEQCLRQLHVKIQKSQNYFQCNHQNCEQKSVIEMLCERCQNHFCVEHRHIAECRPEMLSSRAKRRQDYLNSLKQYQIAKVEIDKNFEEKAQKLTKPKDKSMMQKIQLMKLKSLAIGNKNISADNRIYWKVCHPKNIKGSVQTVLYIDKQWSLKRSIIDTIKKCELNPKYNIDENDVIVIHKSKNAILNDDNNINLTVDNLVQLEILGNGDELEIKLLSDGD